MEGFGGIGPHLQSEPNFTNRRKDVTFIRTPKYNAGTSRRKGGFLKRYRTSRNVWSFFEVALGVHFTVITAIAFYHGHLVPGFFLSLFMIGFYWAGIASLIPSRARAAQVTLNAPSEAGA